jgi:hypothetical protein
MVQSYSTTSAASASASASAFYASPSSASSAHFRRSERHASRAASTRISQILANENSDTETVWPRGPATDAPIAVPVANTAPIAVPVANTAPVAVPSQSYINSPVNSLVMYYVELANNTPDAECRTEYTTKIYECLMTDHMVLARNPKFREAVVAKGNQLLNDIKKQKLELEDSGFTDHMITVRDIVFTTIKNPALKKKMNTMIEGLMDSYSNYAHWAKRDKLVQSILVVKDIAEAIKNHPEYVA